VALCRYTDESGSLERKSIVNGFNARKDYKFFVSIFACDRANPNTTCERLCGGSMITDTTVLTAAHCIDFLQDPYPNQDPYLKVEARDFTDKYSPKDEIEVRDTMLHPRWKSDEIEDGYDIALLYLEKKPRNRSPIRLCTSKYALYNINVIGMGILDPISDAIPDVLQQVRLREYNKTNCPIIDDEYVDDIDKNIDENIQICLAGDYKDSCNGDSGGPALPEISNTCVYGIVSYGSLECGWDGNSWGVYTRVAAYKKWIEQNV